MIPLIDAYLREIVVDRLKWLRANSIMIDEIFSTLGSKTTLNSLKKFVLEKNIKVLLGYPREEQSLPCYVINIAIEDESAIGIGDNVDDYEEEWNEFDESTKYVLDGVYFNSKFRIECWSDNADLTSYLYIILKWILLSSRKKMLSTGLQLPSLSGADIEPVPDYLSIFVYRRSVVLSVTYENLFIDDDILRGDGEYHFPIGVTPKDLHIKNNPYFNYKKDEEENDYI